MITYIVRRLLLMVPTLVGITFLLFMLIALSPGGVGAALRVAGGGATEATNRAVQEAYLEDRYGLDAPKIVQYGRWLARISPVKFGVRDQVATDGTLQHPPKPVPVPPLWQWFASELPAAPAARTPWSGEAPIAEKRLAYTRALDEYAQRRAAFVAARANLKEEAGRFLRASGRGESVTARGDPIEARLRGFTPDRAAPGWPVVEDAGARMLREYAAAQAAREALSVIFAARPYPEAGIAIIPGVVNLAAPDLGVSFARGRPVADLIARALPVTLLLNMLAFPIIYAIAIPAGIGAATRQGSWFDVSSGATFVALWSVPTVWAGTLAIGFLASDRYLGWFPVSGLHNPEAERMPFLPSFGAGGFERGYLLDLLWHLALPVACLVYGGFAILSKQTRAAMLDNFNMDYVRTAKAKGVEQRVIVFSHVFRNSLLPLITMFATVFPAMLAGSVVVERIFTIPGMGSLILEAISLKDREIILANATMIAIVNMLALLAADVLYALADPRVSYS